MTPLCNKYVVYQCNDGVLEDCSMVKGNVRAMQQGKGGRAGTCTLAWHGTTGSGVRAPLITFS